MMPAAFRSWTSLAPALCSRSARMSATRAWRRATLCHSPRQFPDPLRASRKRLRCSGRCLGVAGHLPASHDRQVPEADVNADAARLLRQGLDLVLDHVGTVPSARQARCYTPTALSRTRGPGTRPVPRSGRGELVAVLHGGHGLTIRIAKVCQDSRNEAWTAVRGMTWSGAPGRPGLGSGISIPVRPAEADGAFAFPGSFSGERLVRPDLAPLQAGSGCTWVAAPMMKGLAGVPPMRSTPAWSAVERDLAPVTWVPQPVIARGHGRRSLRQRLFLQMNAPCRSPKHRNIKKC